MKHGIISIFVLMMACAPIPIAPASAPMASPASNAEAKVAEVPAGKAAIYIMKRQGFFGAGVLWSVYIDGILRAQLPRKSYVRVLVEPGDRVVVVGDQYGQGRLDLKCAAGEARFVELTPKARGPREMDADEGRAALKSLSLVRDVAAP